jgi:hypothetical protein
MTLVPSLHPQNDQHPNSNEGDYPVSLQVATPQATHQRFQGIARHPHSGPGMFQTDANSPVAWPTLPSIPEGPHENREGYGLNQFDHHTPYNKE